MRVLGRFVTLTLAGIAMVTTFGAAVYLHENVTSWEAPAIFVGLAVGAVAVAGYARYRRNGWLVALVAGLAFTFSFVMALVHGWELQAGIVVNLALFAVTVFVITRVSRANIRQAHALREIGDAVKGTALFRDDGERMTFYPNRTGTLQRFLGISVLASWFGAAFVWLPEHSLRDTVGHWVFAIGCSYSVALALALLYRAVVRRPTLIVGPDGLIENGSLFATGVGRLGWDEFLAITTGKASSSRFAPKTLVIFLLDARVVHRRMPLVKRLASILNGPRSFVLRIWPYLLDQPVEVVAERIKRYEETHAPEGWFRKDNDEDNGNEDDGPHSPASHEAE